MKLGTTTFEQSPQKLFQNKRMINSFLLANLCDVVITSIALSLPGFVEKGVVAGDMFEQARYLEPLIFKIAITAFMIGLFALTANRRGRWSAPVATALRIATVAVWVVVAWNELNVVLALGEML